MEDKLRADNLQSQWAVNQEAAYSSAKKSQTWNNELCMKFYNLIQTVLSVLRFSKRNNCSQSREAIEEGWFILAMDLIPNIPNNSSMLIPTLTPQYGVLFPQKPVEWFHCLQDLWCSYWTSNYNSLFCDSCTPDFCIAWRQAAATKQMMTPFHVISYRAMPVIEL